MKCVKCAHFGGWNESANVHTDELTSISGWTEMILKEVNSSEKIHWPTCHGLESSQLISGLERTNNFSFALNADIVGINGVQWFFGWSLFRSSAESKRFLWEGQTEDPCRAMGKGIFFVLILEMHACI